RSNKFTVAAGSTDAQVINRLKDVGSFVNEEGAGIFGNSRIPIISTNESIAERFQRARVQEEENPVTEQKGFEDILGIFDDEDDLFATVEEPEAKKKVKNKKEEKKEDFEDWLLEFLED
ncbi:hypothetical protein, partial [Bacillus mycoides]|uniref:hypothetical protein n=1 Tax=Bacillus mycoides TaxID=1405 RepID=UPI003A80C7BE